MRDPIDEADIAHQNMRAAQGSIIPAAYVPGPERLTVDLSRLVRMQMKEEK